MPTDHPVAEQPSDHLTDHLRRLLHDDPDIITDSDRLRSSLTGRLPDPVHTDAGADADPVVDAEDVDADQKVEVEVEVEAICLVAELGIAAQMRDLPLDMPVDLAVPLWLEERLENDRTSDLDRWRRSLDVWAEALDCEVRRSLVELIAEDRTLAFDAQRCRAALLEACPARPLLVNVLVRAIDGGVVQEIEKLPDNPTARGAVLDGLQQRLTDSHLREGTGQWTLESWLLALGHEVEPQPVNPPSADPWSLLTELLACVAVGVLLVTQLFWSVWARDDLNRYWFGIESVPWAIGTAIVVAGTAGLFVNCLYKLSWLFSGFPDRRTGPGWIRRQTFLSVVCGCAAAWAMLAIERHLTAEWNTPVACVAGVIVGLAALKMAGKGASLLLLGGYVLVWFIYAFHWVTWWQYDPEHVCFVSNAPGVDGYFVFFVGVAGLSGERHGPLSNTASGHFWKRLPGSVFQLRHSRYPASSVGDSPATPTKNTK